MYIADRQGVISDIIYGPDERTQIRPETQSVLFTVYAVPGIKKEQTEAHLRDIEQNVRSIAPQAEMELLEIFSAR
jgi:DNA/RNA-binding domain of Phe-tRNA-synthetase-like protein